MGVDLTSHEQQLLELLVSGASNKVAAKQLGIALRTMELHRQKLMLKMGAKSAAQLGYVYCNMKQNSASGFHAVSGSSGESGAQTESESLSQAMAS